MQKKRPSDDALKAIREILAHEANPVRATKMLTFFKTGKGQYGEGDRFVGVSAPLLRTLSRRYRHLGIKAIEELLYAPIHEERLLALFILVLQFKAGTPLERKEIYTYYFKHITQVNNWDLVDTTAPHIVGAYLYKRDRAPLYQLAKSDIVWQRRIAMLSTFYFIRQHDFATTLSLANDLLDDTHDLIHKAVGWMLREVGNRELASLTNFLDKHAPAMPRTMLRYSIEKCTLAMRKAYMSIKNKRSPTLNLV